MICNSTKTQSRTRVSALFIIVSDQQLEGAKLVADHLPFSSYAVNPYSGLSVSLAELTSVERPISFVLTPRTAIAARRTLRVALALANADRVVIVVGQDVGTIERTAIAVARGAGALVAMMPDGIPTPAPAAPSGARRAPWLVRELADRVLVRAGLLAGKRGTFFSSDPDLVLSWGAGWNNAIRTRTRRALVADCGSPRSDLFANMPPPPRNGNVLICSQPLFLGSHGMEPANADVLAWYAWLAEMAQPADPRVRIRLHPGERSPHYPLPTDVRPLLDQSVRPLHADLAWADAVIAPYSTVLVEAVASGRVPMTAGGAEVWGPWATNAYLADPRMTQIDFRRSPKLAEIIAAADAHAGDVASLRDEFMAHVGDSARLAAQAIVQLSETRPASKTGAARHWPAG